MAAVTICSDFGAQYIKKQEYYFAYKGLYSQSNSFPVVLNGWESWEIKKAEHQKTDAFELWCWKNSSESLGHQGDQISQS